MAKKRPNKGIGSGNYKHKHRIYLMYDKEGNLVDRGSAPELAEKYFTCIGNFYRAERKKTQWIQQSFRVEKEKIYDIG